MEALGREERRSVRNPKWAYFRARICLLGAVSAHFAVVLETAKAGDGRGESATMGATRCTRGNSHISGGRVGANGFFRRHGPARNLSTDVGFEFPEAAQLLNQAGFTYTNVVVVPDAEPLYDRTLAINEKPLGPEHFDVATSLDNLASMLTA
jgi:hypothetical protein